MNKFLLFFITFLSLSFLVGCHHRGSLLELEKIDTLLAQHHDSLAWAAIQAVDTAKLSEMDQAYYALLLTQAQYKNYIPFASATPIGRAVEFYSRSRDMEKRTRSLIYKGCVNEVLGQPDTAVACYHEAEATARPTDFYNLAYAKMRLGFLYQSQVVGSKSIALQKFREALPLFHSINDKHYELICLNEIGNIYRNIDEKHDSAVKVINKAIRLSRQLNDKYFLFANLFSLSEFYSVRKQDFNKGKELALQALKAGGEQIDHPRAHYRLAQDYLSLGQIDSARHYISLAPPAVSAADSILYYSVMSELELKKGNVGTFRTLYLKSDSMDDSVLVAGLNHRLLAVEKKYDTQRVELENTRLQSQRLKLWLFLLIAFMALAVMVWIVTRYREQIREKEKQYDDVKSQLSTTLTRLKEISTTIDGYRSKLHDAEQSIDALSRDIDNERHQFMLREQQFKELRTAVNQQIQVVKQLIYWSETMPAEKFMNKFAQMMTLPRGKAKTRAKSQEIVLPEFWQSLHTLANGLHNDVLVRAQQTAGRTLRADEINYLALFSCGFEPSLIMTCLGYDNVGTLHNKRSKLSQILHVDDLKDFVWQ